MKILSMAILVVGLASAACLAEEVCEPAVDIADSMNVNARQDCDGEKTGLNRLVHKMFSQESATVSSSGSVDNNVEADPAAQQTSSLINNANQLAEARYQLLSNIGLKCPKGFRLTDEHYLPSGSHLRINLFYECL